MCWERSFSLNITIQKVLRNRYLDSVLFIFRKRENDRAPSLRNKWKRKYRHLNRKKKDIRDDITYILLWRRLSLLCLHQQTFGSGFLIISAVCFHHVPFLRGDDMLLLTRFLPRGGTRWQITWRHWKVVGQQCQRWRHSTCSQRRDCWEEGKRKRTQTISNVKVTHWRCLNTTSNSSSFFSALWGAWRVRALQLHVCRKPDIKPAASTRTSLYAKIFSVSYTKA